MIELSETEQQLFTKFKKFGPGLQNSKFSEIWPKIGQKMPKNEKIKNLIDGTLKLSILQPWSINDIK